MELKLTVNADEVLEQITSPTIAGATMVMMQQREKGLAKYGTSLEDSGLSVAALIEHAEQEAADLSVYLQQLKTAYKSDRREIANRLEEIIGMEAGRGIFVTLRKFIKELRA